MVIRNARLGPLLERNHKRVLRQVFGHADIAHEARQRSNQLGRLDPPDGINRAMNVGSCHVLQLVLRRRLYAQALFLLS